MSYSTRSPARKPRKTSSPRKDGHHNGTATTHNNHHEYEDNHSISTDMDNEDMNKSFQARYLQVLGAIQVLVALFYSSLTPRIPIHDTPLDRRLAMVSNATLACVGALTLSMGLWATSYEIHKAIHMQLVSMSMQVGSIIMWTPRLDPVVFYEHKTWTYVQFLWIALGTLLLLQGVGHFTHEAPHPEQSHKMSHAQKYFTVEGAMTVGFGLAGMLMPNELPQLMIKSSTLTIHQQFMVDLRMLITVVLGVMLISARETPRWINVKNTLLVTAMYKFALVYILFWTEHPTSAPYTPFYLCLGACTATSAVVAATIALQ